MSYNTTGSKLNWEGWDKKVFTLDGFLGELQILLNWIKDENLTKNINTNGSTHSLTASNYFCICVDAGYRNKLKKVFKKNKAAAINILKSIRVSVDNNIW